MFTQSGSARDAFKGRLREEAAGAVKVRVDVSRPERLARVVRGRRPALCSRGSSSRESSARGQLRSLFRQQVGPGVPWTLSRAGRAAPLRGEGRPGAVPDAGPSSSPRPELSAQGSDCRSRKEGVPLVHTLTLPAVPATALPCCGGTARLGLCSACV